MNRLIRIWELAEKENAENRRKAIHNYGCKTSELHPYDNSAFLEMVGATLALLREAKSGKGKSMIREILADLCHQQWSGWMEYLFSKGIFNKDGTWTMPAWAVDRWKKQMNTPYANLSDTEQESDRIEADKFLIILIDDGYRGENTVATAKDYKITD